MTIDLDQALGGVLGHGRARSHGELDELSGRSDVRSQSAIESEFGRAGWFSGGAEPYPAPETPVDAPRLARVPVVPAHRRLWLSRNNPAAAGFDFSDINDDRYFPWWHPELAPVDGWWLSSYQTPKGRQAVSEITTGDLVVCLSPVMAGGRGSLRRDGRTVVEGEMTGTLDDASPLGVARRLGVAATATATARQLPTSR